MRVFSAWLLNDLAEAAVPVTQLISPAILSNLSSAVVAIFRIQAKNVFWDSKSGVCYWMPIGVGSFNLLPKVRVEALDELAYTVNYKHMFIYEGLDHSPNIELYKSMLMIFVLPSSSTTIMLIHSTWA